jgi:hypothetical protein
MISRSDAAVGRSHQYRPAQTEAMDRRDNWAKIQRELQQLENPPPLGAKKPGIKTLPINLPKIDIVVVGAAAFHCYIRRKDTEVFIISLYKIDRLIKSRKSNLQEDLDSSLIKQRLPTCYTGYEDTFSKDTSN